MNDFLSGRATLPSRPRQAMVEQEPPRPLPPLRMPANQTRDISGDSCECPSKSPQIELLELDGRIEQIIVTCGCGERITLECSYRE